MFKNKNSMLLSGILALGVSLGACTKDATENAAAPAPTGDQAAQATGEAKPDEHAGHADVSAVLTHYEAIRALLVADKGAEVAEHARQLQAAAAQAGAAAPAAGKAHLEAVAKQAEALAAVPAADMAQMRKTFGEVSQPLVTMMTEMPAMAQGHHVFECPMAEGYNRWVQKDATLANPYMGQSMPDCGKEVALNQGGGHDEAHGDHAHGDHGDHAGH